MGTEWFGLLAPINQPTGDGRRMAEGAFTWRTPPMGLKWQRTDEMGHDASVIIGSTTQLHIATVADALARGWVTPQAVADAKLNPDDQGVWGVGELFDDADAGIMPRLAEDVAEVKLLLDRGVVGPSVDAGAASYYFVRTGSDVPLTGEELDQLLWDSMEAGTEPDIERLFDHYEIAAATLVVIPAFAQARPFQLREPAALTAAVIGSTDLPVGARDAAWDQQAATGRIFDKFTAADGTVDVTQVSKAYLYRDEAADPQTMGAYKLGFADVVDGELTIIPDGCSACAGGHGVDAADIPGDQKDKIKTKLCALYDTVQATYDDFPDCPFGADTSAGTGVDEALVATLTAASGLLAVDPSVFADPQLPTYTPVHREQRDGEPFVRVLGHVAAAGVCHAGITDVCLTAPTSATSYALFHRYVPADFNVTGDTPLAVGRLTSGLGRVGTRCTHLSCRGKDDHACDLLGLGEAIAHYDALSTLAWVRAGEDANGHIYIAGIERPGLSPAEQAMIGRDVSGDWREYAAHLEMIEVLALATDAPGFPAPSVTTRHGRQVSLTASFGPPREHPSAAQALAASQTRLAATVADMVVARLTTAGAVTAAMPMPPEAQTPMMPAGATEHTGAMVALRMTDEHATRLAVDGGEAPEELHATAAYLGEAANWSDGAREQLVNSLRPVADMMPPVECNGFSVSAFNPDGEDPCVVMGLSGPAIAQAHTQIMDALAPFAGQLPEQHQPHVEHVTLAYTPDPGAAVASLLNRVGPVTFDRLRISFAGDIIDLPLGGTPPPPPMEPSEALAAEVEAALGQLDVADRAARAAALTHELEAVNVC